MNHLVLILLSSWDVGNTDPVSCSCSATMSPLNCSVILSPLPKGEGGLEPKAIATNQSNRERSGGARQRSRVGGVIGTQRATGKATEAALAEQGCRLGVPRQPWKGTGQPD